jgi:crotonobetainyl-CoA:carnitine CoA-transferase CaiB-like acyl-CoA transferase
MGVTVDDFPYMATCGQDDPDKVARMDAIWQAYLAAHTADEVEAVFRERGMPVSTIKNADDAFAHPHWQARRNFITMKDATSGEHFIDIATAPRFLATPCDTYKGAPLLGQETDRVMREVLGYSAERVEELKEAGAIAASLTTK